MKTLDILSLLGGVSASYFIVPRMVKNEKNTILANVLSTAFGSLIIHHYYPRENYHIMFALGGTIGTVANWYKPSKQFLPLTFYKNWYNKFLIPSQQYQPEAKPTITTPKAFYDRNWFNNNYAKLMTWK